jgi:hypothetical protein
MDNSLRSVNGCDLPGILRRFAHARSDIHRVFHNLEGLAAKRNREVRSLDPDVLARLREPFELTLMVLTLAQAVPELLVGITIAGFFIDENSVVLAPHLSQRVADDIEKLLVGGQDRAIKRKFDDGLGFIEGSQFRGHLPRGGRETEHAVAPGWGPTLS